MGRAAGSLPTDSGQLSASAPLDEQRDKIPYRTPLEPRVSVVHNVRNLLRRELRILAGQTVDSGPVTHYSTRPSAHPKANRLTWMVCSQPPSAAMPRARDVGLVLRVGGVAARRRRRATRPLIRPPPRCAVRPRRRSSRLSALRWEALPGAPSQPVPSPDRASQVRSGVQQRGRGGDEEQRCGARADAGDHSQRQAWRHGNHAVAAAKATMAPTRNRRSISSRRATARAPKTDPTLMAA